MELEYTEIDEMFAELGGRPATWWGEVEERAWLYVEHDGEPFELEFEATPKLPRWDYQPRHG